MKKEGPTKEKNERERASKSLKWSHKWLELKGVKPWTFFCTTNEKKVPRDYDNLNLALWGSIMYFISNLKPFSGSLTWYNGLFRLRQELHEEKDEKVNCFFVDFIQINRSGGHVDGHVLEVVERRPDVAGLWSISNVMPTIIKSYAVLPPKYIYKIKHTNFFGTVTTVWWNLYLLTQSIPHISALQVRSRSLSITWSSRSTRRRRHREEPTSWPSRETHS